MGSEDIRKQLPAESAMFDDVNNNWKRTTKELFDAGTAYKGAHVVGMLERLGDMDAKLDRIQKSLDEYLETKRQAFPRFYFLSNDELLEILSQTRDPHAVQPHLIKCFDAVKNLTFGEGDNSKQMMALNSAESEKVTYP